MYASYCVYVCCMYVYMCVCNVCISLFHVVGVYSVRFRFDFRVFPVHVISVYTGSVAVLVAVVLCYAFLTGLLILSFLFFYLSLCLFLVSSNFLSLHTTRDVPSIAVDLVAFHPNS